MEQKVQISEDGYIDADSGLVITNFADRGSNFMKELQWEVQNGFKKDVLMHHIRQEQIKKMDALDITKRDVEGLGRHIGSINIHTWARWAMQEKDCWSDKKFIEEFLKENPECRV